jgi:hypothetical protein
MTAAVANRPILGTPQAAHETPVRRPGTSSAIVWLTVLAGLYNALLAIVNAHAVRLGMPHVVASEALILGIGGLIAYRRHGLRPDDWPVLVLLYLFVVIATFLSLLNGFLFADPVRNIAIIAVFVILGRRAEAAEVDRAFLWLTVATLAVLILEMAASAAYVAIFAPASYYEATRGVAKSIYEDTGLFGAATGFASRFSFGIFTDHRTASVFLEQVSLANYASVLCIYLLATWQRLLRGRRILFVATVILILVTNNTRTSSALALVALAGYFLFPLLPRIATLLYAPLVLGIAFVVVGDHPVFGQDDLAGRLSITVEALRSFTAPMLLGTAVPRARTFLDTGYGYIIASSTIFGLLSFWFFVAHVVRQRDTAERRTANMLSIYVFANLLIGGTAIFSIKIAAPLWLLIGFVSRNRSRKLGRPGETA